MKKILLAYGALVVVVVLLAFAKFNGFSFLSSFGGKSVVINNHSYNLLIANDDKTRQVGLSKRKSFNKNTGMLFIFQKKGIYSFFWMKNTEIPLDMLFLMRNKIIYIVKNAPPQAEKV